jgi:hypothetical protein
MATMIGKTAAEMLLHIKDVGEFDDWRDVFQAIHEWGYKTDFTYNPVTDINRNPVEEYLREFIAAVYND